MIDWPTLMSSGGRVSSAISAAGKSPVTAANKNIRVTNICYL